MFRDLVNLGDFEKSKTPAEKLRFLAHFGNLAPSSHNMQPWLFRLSENTIEIRPNPKRRLQHSDPSDREQILSLGAAVANILMAAEALGLPYARLPAMAPIAAAISFQNFQAVKRDERVLSALSRRQCNRLQYLPRTVPESFRGRILSMATPKMEVAYVSDVPRMRQISDIVLDATGEAFADKLFRLELSRWIKPSFPRYREGMPGYYIGVPAPVSFFLPWIIRNFNIGSSQKKMIRPALEHSAAFIVFGSEDGVESWLEIGESFERLAVEAHMLGMAFSVFGAPIEIGSHHHRLGEIAGLRARPQLFLRLGYPPKAIPYSPRLPLSEVIDASQ